MSNFERVLDEIVTEKLKERESSINYNQDIKKDIIFEPQKIEIKKYSTKINPIEIDPIEINNDQSDSFSSSTTCLPKIPDRLTIDDISDRGEPPVLTICQNVTERKIQEKIKNNQNKSVLELSKNYLKNKLINQILEPATLTRSTIKPEPVTSILERKVPLLFSEEVPELSFEMASGSILETVREHVPSIKMPKLDLSYFEIPKKINFPKIEIPTRETIKNTLIDIDFIDDLLPDANSFSNNGSVNNDSHEDLAPGEYQISGKINDLEIPSKQFKQLNQLTDAHQASMDSPIQLNLNTPIKLENPLVYCGQAFEINPFLKCQNFNCVRCYSKKLLKQGLSKSFLKKVRQHLEEKYPGRFKPQKLAINVFSGRLFENYVTNK